MYAEGQAPAYTFDSAYWMADSRPDKKNNSTPNAVIYLFPEESGEKAGEADVLLYTEVCDQGG